MQTKTKGIVLNQIKYSDSQNIANIYTLQFGRMSYMVRGANKKKSVCRAALLQPLSIVEMDVNHNPKKDIQTIRDIRVAVPFFRIPFDPVKNCLALFIAEVLHKTLKHAESDERLFHFIENSVCELDTCESGIGNFHLVFLSGLAGQLGFAPETKNGDEFRYFDMLNGVFKQNKPLHPHFLELNQATVFRDIMSLNYGNLSLLPMNRTQRAELLDIFIEYYKLHLADFNSLQSIEIMHKLWE